MLHNALRHAFRELRYLRTPADVRASWEKVRHLAPRYLRCPSVAEAPPSLQLEPTNACNLECACCPRSRSKRARGFMALDLFQSIIDDAVRIGTRRVRLFLLGESLVHPHIVEMISYLKKSGMAFQLTTNGMLLDADIGAAILRSGVTRADHVTFSIYGYTAETHERLMRGVNHERVVANILEFVEARRRQRINGPVIETILYETDENRHETAQYLRFWRPKVDHVRYVPRISHSWASYNTGRPFQWERKRTCPNLWDRLTIFWTGDATICGCDVDGSYTFGNVGKHPLLTLWRCGELEAIRRLHREGQFKQIPICAGCDMP